MALPSKGSPFEGISGTRAPARNTKIPNLTAQVTLARTRREALTHGGLLTPQQQKAASDAGKALAAHKTLKKAAAAPKQASQPPPKTSARTPQGLRTTLPLPSTAPFKVPPPSAPPPASPTTTSSPGRRGALGGAHPEQPNRNFTPAKSTGPGFGGLQHAASVGLGTGLSVAESVPRTLLTPIRPGATHTAAEDVKPTTTHAALADIAKRSAATGAAIQGLGIQGRVPTSLRIPSIDLVGVASAAGKKQFTVDELKALEAQGRNIGLSPRLDKRFTAMALKNGYSHADLDGASPSKKIDMAFSHPAALPLRLLANFGGGVARLGTLPAGVEGAVRETAAGHGLKVASALGQGLYSELPIIGKHPAAQTAVSDPFGFFTQFMGAGKTVGDVSRLARIGSTAADRVVPSAMSGTLINRGALSKNAFTATGQLASDKAAERVPALGARLESKQIDTLVRSAVNKHAPPFVAAQRGYKAALDKIGRGRAAELQAYQAAGGKPEQLAAFYRAQGEKGPAKFFDRVAANTKTLSDTDHAFLNAHSAIAAHTTQAKIAAGGFSDTASNFRRYSPLIRSSARLGDPEAQRILALRDEYVKGFNVMPEQDVAALRGAIDQGVQDYATKHVASGGIEPSYVEYGKPKPLIAAPYQPSPGGIIGFKQPRGRQKAETGATFESGKYLIDPTSPLAQNVRAQRAHLSSVLHEDVAKAVGTHLTAGDAIPTGHVFVSETNLRGLRRTVNDLADNPVSAHDYYAQEAETRQGLFDHLSKNATPSGERVPRGEKGYAIPIGSWKRILDHTRPPSRSAYAKAMSKYQKLLISYRPSTIVNNAVGSLPLAMTGGAGPKSFLRAAQAMRDPTLAPAVLRGHGIAGSFAPDVRSRAGAGMDFMRRQSQRGEDFSRLATFFSKAGPTIKKRAGELNMTMDDYARKLAAGEVDEKLLNQALDHTEQFIGDMVKPDGPIARRAGKAILFHRWVGHIAKLLLYTLPVNHPRRLDLLLSLSAYGNQYRQEHGVWPDWYAEYLPLFQHVERVGAAGVPQTFTKTYSTQGVNPFSTINNFANPVSTNDSIKNVLAGVAAPPLQIAFNTIANRPSDSKDPFRYAVGQTVRQIPGVSVFRPQGGMASDSIPFISEKRKAYSSGKKGSPLPYDFRPTARPEGGVLGALLRYGLGGVYDLPAQGPIHGIDQGKHIGAAAKAARKH